MPLESLLKLVETLRGRISAHRAALSQSEALTRYALIDPLLRELGWDTSDPTMVIPEYKSGAGRADYALLRDGHPAIMVEAKSLGTLLDDSVRIQVLGYCMMVGTNHFSVTNGARWEIYDTRREGPIDEKRVVALDLTGTSVSEACLRALALWRPSVQSGIVAEGSSPVLTPALEIDSSPASVPVAETTPPVVHYDKALTQQGWQGLSNVSWRKGHSKPAEIQFPDNSSVTVSTWNSLMIEPVRWLIKSNFLTGNRCPIPHGQRYLVSTGPNHSTGKPMEAAKLVDALYVETNYSARDCLRNAQIIIDHVGQDPAQFKVRFS